MLDFLFWIFAYKNSIFFQKICLSEHNFRNIFFFFSYFNFKIYDKTIDKWAIRYKSLCCLVMKLILCILIS